jgi:hypothetical protein
MGSGKTTWAIKEMNEHLDERYLYVTPYLEEVERIVAACPDLHFKQPDDKFSKYESFRKLLSEGENIVLTHELFSRLQLTATVYEQLHSMSYNLILDEVLDVIIPIQETKQDVKMLFDSGAMRADNHGIVQWLDKGYKGKHMELKIRAESKTLIWFEGTLLMWTFPSDILPVFNSVTVLTYLFDGSHMKNYFNLYHIEYQIYHIQDGRLTQGIDTLTEKRCLLQELITVYKGKLNSIGEGDYAQSAHWFERHRQIAHVPINNAYNFFRRVCGAKSDNAMYTIYKKYQKRYKINSYMTSYVPCNSRATNAYSNRTFLAYLVNVFDNPYVVKWFMQQGVEVSQEQFALSQLLQWIWRSAIRNMQPINIYIPSERMRTLFLDWLYCEA